MFYLPKNNKIIFLIISTFISTSLSFNYLNADCRWVCGYGSLGTDGNICISDWSECSGCTQGMSSDQCGGCITDLDGTILQPYTATCPNYLCYYPATKSEFDCSTINGCSGDKRLYCDTESECNSPGTPKACDPIPPNGGSPVIDYGHDCANYHDDCYNCIEHDMSGAGSCGYCVNQQKCIQGDSNGPWHVFTKEQCGAWLWDSGNDCSNSPPPTGCSKESCVNINGEWVSGECRIQRCICRNCNSQNECCDAWGGCESNNDY
ncbi:MAG: hypothetical protein GF368_01635, partial [Candidatus Aenigmarchaeota archaeon]|nr:hypothetical protein [Candidatus Aenigmarchaeota archaeon]